MAKNGVTSMIFGKLAGEPERKFDNGPVEFSIPVHKSKKVDGEWKTDTAWYGMKMWGKGGERALEELHKGDMVIVSGRQECREWKEKIYMEIHSSDYSLVPTGEPAPAPVEDDDDGLDF